MSHLTSLLNQQFSMLSICIILKNELHNLNELLPLLMSVQTKGAQIVFVDTGSEDGSVEFLRKNGQDVQYFEWIDDFSAARNFSFSLAQNPLILWLDADDRPNELFWSNLEKFIIQPQINPCAHTFLIKSPTIEGEGQVFRQIRLIPNFKGIQFTGSIHEELRTSCVQNQVKILDEEIELIHIGYFSEETRILKSERNFRLIQKAYEQKPFDLALHIQMGHSFYQKKQFEQAFEYYSKALDLDGYETTDEYLSLPLFIANTLQNMGLKEEAQDWYVRSIELKPELWSAHYQLAKYFVEKEELSHAEEVLLTYVNESPKIGFVAESVQSLQINGRVLLALLLFQKKDYQGCLKYLELVWTDLNQKPPFDEWLMVETYWYLNQRQKAQKIILLKNLTANSEVQNKIILELNGEKSNFDSSPTSTQGKSMSSVAPHEMEELFGTIKSPLKTKGKKNTLSVCMIVKNEADNIEAAIKSFAPFADEIIVNDTGSTDGTLEILKRLPVKVIQNPWEGHFSKARNQSIEAATCSWILWMDADDRVPVDQVQDFIALKSAPTDRCFGFQVINTQAGMPIGARFTQTRMFPNHPDLRFERKVHEQILFACAKKGLHAFYLNTTIWHTGYESEELKKKKSLRNIELLSQEPDVLIDPILPMQIGDAHAILENWPKALESYKAALEVPHIKKINQGVWADLPNCIGRCYQKMHDYNQALEWFEEALIRSPERAETLFYIAEIKVNQNDLKQAESYFLKVLAAPFVASGLANQYDVVIMYSYFHLTRIKFDEKSYHEAKKYAKLFVEKYPQVVESHILLGKTNMALGCYDESIVAFEQALSQNPKLDESAWHALESAYELTGQIQMLNQTRQRFKREFLGETQSLSQKPLLSLAMIVKNEEGHLEKCLESAQGLWDELIIVDTGSTDKTIEIAQSFGAKVIQWSWQNDFAKARNISLENATGEWILWLDADDIVLEEDKARIRHLVQNSSPKGYGFLIKNSQDFGRTGTVFNQIRLFPNRQNLRFVGRIHEQILGALTQNGIPVEFKNIRIIHTGYVNAEVEQAKQRRNLEILKEEILDPQHVTSVKLFSIGGAFMDLGEFDMANDWFQKALDRSIQLGEDPHIREIAPVRIGECLMAMGCYSEAQKIADETYKRSPFNPEVIRLKAVLAKTNQFNGAAKTFYSMLMWFEEGSTFIPVDFQKIKIISAQFLADYWNLQGRQSLAVLILKSGIAVNDGHNFGGLELADLYFEAELWNEAILLLEFGLKVNPSPVIYYELGRNLIMQNNIQKALDLLQEGADKYPIDPEIRTLLSALKEDIA